MKYKYLALAPIAMAGALLRQNKKIKVTKHTLPFKNLPIDGTGKWGWQEYTFTEKVK